MTYISSSAPIPSREGREDDGVTPWPRLTRVGILAGLVAASWALLIGFGDLVAHLV